MNSQFIVWNSTAKIKVLKEKTRKGTSCLEYYFPETQEGSELLVEKNRPVAAAYEQICQHHTWMTIVDLKQNTSVFKSFLFKPILHLFHSLLE